MRQHRMSVTGGGRIGSNPRELVLRYGDRKGQKMTQARIALHLPISGQGAEGGTHTEWFRLRIVEWRR